MMKKLLPKISAKMYGSALLLCAGEKLLWCLFLILCYCAYQFSGVYAAAISGVLGLLIMQTVLFFVSYRLMKLVRREDPSAIRFSSFPHLLAASAVRLIYNFIWSIPLIALTVQLYRYIFVLDVTVWNRDFTKIGEILAPGATTHMYIGTVVFFSLLILSVFVFTYGLNRWKAFDFQQVANHSIRQSLRNVRYVRKQAKRPLFCSFWVHVLVCLPAFVLPLLLPYLKLAPLLTGKVMNDLFMVYTYLKVGIVSGEILMLSMAVFFICYVPALPLRKLRTAAAVVNCYERKKH